MLVIYQIHDFCANNFHYHNVADDDYRWCSHYRTSATACGAAVAKVADRNSSADWGRIDGDCNGTTVLIHWSCSDDDNVDGIGAVDLMSGSKSHLVSAAKSAPVEYESSH